MSIRLFVSVSSLLLAGWLGLTFISEVPPNRYPKPETAKAATAPDEDAMLLAKAPDSP
jgi:hypothetical protein